MTALMAQAHGNRLPAFNQGLRDLRSRLPEYEEKLIALHLDLGVLDAAAIGERVANEFRQVVPAIAKSRAASLRGGERLGANRAAKHFEADVGAYASGVAGRALVAVERHRRRSPTTATVGSEREPLESLKPRVDHFWSNKDPDSARRKHMSVKEDASRIVHAIAEFEQVPGDPRRGRHNLTGPGVQEALKNQQQFEMPPDRINEGVELLESKGLIDVQYYAGTSPFSFGGVELTAEGRVRYEESIKNHGAQPADAAQKTSTADRRKVFVIYGRDEKRRKAMFDFLRAIGLQPIEWAQARALTGKPAPYVGEILEAAFGQAQAVVALFTGDDLAHLRSQLLNPGESEELPTPQARPNVLFEAGMAMGSHDDRTLFVEVGDLRAVSDVAGRHMIRINPNTSPLPMKDRQEIAARLRDAGCDVDTSGTDWHTAGDF